MYMWSANKNKQKDKSFCIYKLPMLLHHQTNGSATTDKHSQRPNVDLILPPMPFSGKGLHEHKGNHKVRPLYETLPGCTTQHTCRNYM